MAQDKTICKTCGIKLTEENRHKREKRHCKECIRLRDKAGRERRKDKIVAQRERTKGQRQAWQKDYYQLNKEKINARTGKHTHENRDQYNGYASKRREDPAVRESERIKSRDYNRAHKEERKIYDIKYKAENNEKLKIKAKVHRSKHRDKFVARHMEYRARKNGIPGKYGAADVEEMWLEQLGRCVYCKCRLGDSYHVDHIIPITREGSTNWPSNLQLLCPPCNSSKGNKNHEEYLEYQAKYNTRPIVL